MFDISSNKIVLVSILLTVCSISFFYYILRKRLNDVENDMSSMFNLVSSLNDEQKRLWEINYAHYNQDTQNTQNTQLQMLNQPYTTPVEAFTEDEPSVVKTITSEYIDNYNELNKMNINDIDNDNNIDDTDDDDGDRDDYLEDDAPKTVNIFLQNNDLRLLVSEDETDEVDTYNQNKQNILMTEPVNFNKWKVNELKDYLDSITQDKNIINKSKKLKKKELIECIEYVLKNNNSEKVDNMNDVLNTSQENLFNVSDELNINAVNEVDEVNEVDAVNEVDEDDAVNEVDEVDELDNDDGLDNDDELDNDDDLDNDDELKNIEIDNDILDTDVLDIDTSVVNDDNDSDN